MRLEIAIGNAPRGKLKKLNKLSVGKMTSMVRGRFTVKAKAIRVAQETRNGLVVQIKPAEAWAMLIRLRALQLLVTPQATKRSHKVGLPPQ